MRKMIVGFLGIMLLLVSVGCSTFGQPVIKSDFTVTTPTWHEETGEYADDTTRYKWKIKGVSGQELTTAMAEMKSQWKADGSGDFSVGETAIETSTAQNAELQGQLFEGAFSTIENLPPAAWAAIAGGSSGGGGGGILGGIIGSVVDGILGSLFDSLASGKILIPSQESVEDEIVEEIE